MVRFSLMRASAAAFTLAAMLVMTAPVLAAVEGIGVSPTSQEVEIAPGSSKTGTITVINDGASDITYKVSVADYHVTNELYKADFNSISSSADVSAVSWFTLPKTTAVIKGGDEAALPYTIRVPASAAIGGHYVAVFAETVPKLGPGTAIARVQKLGSLFYIGVAGAVTRDGSVASFTAAWLQPGSPLTASLRVRNAGNVHFAASGDARVTDIFGKEMSKGVFKGEVLPGTTRRFDLALAAPGPVGLYKIAVTPHYLDANGPTLSQWVFIMPTLTVIIILATIGLVAALYLGMLTRRLRRQP